MSGFYVVETVEEMLRRILNNLKLANQKLSGIVEVLMEFRLVGKLSYREKKSINKPQHFNNRREAACGLAKPCRERVSTFPQHFNIPRNISQKADLCPISP